MGGIGVGLVGLGTVGAGVVEVLRDNADVIADRLGFPLELRRIATRRPGHTRGLDLSGITVDADPNALIADPDVSVVIELIGGEDVAKEICLRAIEAGKHVVTANKALLAEHGHEIFDAASRRGVDVGFEAAVAGGIPILRSIREGLSANRIESLAGILNGTTNYMLTEMEATGAAFEPVLAEAQRLGYAEADPTFDVDGIDAAQKLALLVSMAFGARLAPRDIAVEGIRDLTPLDFESARAFGYRIKLLGIAKLHRQDGEERIEARVHPTMIPESSLLAKVDGPMNAVAVHGDAVGPTLFYGAGAGARPTASAVVSDLMEIAREIDRGHAGRVAPLAYVPASLKEKTMVPAGELSCPAYLVFDAEDRPGVLGRIASGLGACGISIQSVIQHGAGTDSVPVVVLTHPAREGDVLRALEKIDALPELRGPTRFIRIDEDL